LRDRRSFFRPVIITYLLSLDYGAEIMIRCWIISKE
jgi:hypothetical protein